ncbi:DUF177 domain-containing protein [Rhodobacteraceae bacterium 2376]|uniref:DUF177 domain-containing protein n=1 Tax=Rhabdonatronobacter sediminivivens TaxID=2743469 RepID=A0A7Z0L038_9RHOB|nr:DUF177 domain-containing protein [Rhabdonatronobacter sediminivivens]
MGKPAVTDDPKSPAARSDLTLVLRRNDLASRAHLRFELVPDASTRQKIAAALGLQKLRKLRFAGELRPLGRKDWELVADLGATVVQDCVVSLAPVPARIDERVERRFLADFVEPEGDDIETPEDEDAEALGAVIDVGAVAIEALTLALPPFPRAEGAALGEDGALRAAPDGQVPLQDADLRPFAALAGLRKKMDGKE